MIGSSSVFFFKQKTAYEVRISDWSSDVCSSDLARPGARIVAVDINERSRELCERNAAELGCDNIEVLAPGQVEPALRFDLLWSNPPIRLGKEALRQLLLLWLRRLTPDGHAVLVLGRNLGPDSTPPRPGGPGLPPHRHAPTKG